MTDTAIAVDACRPGMRRHAGAWHLFLVLVTLASLLPLVVLPYTQHVMGDASSALNIVIALNFVGANFHVAATGWFYTDPVMRSHFRSNPARYLIAPCLLIAGGAALFQFGDASLRGTLLVLFFCWQLWHYQKQNVGLLSFIAAGTDGVPLSIWERRTLALAAFAGMLGFFSLNTVGLPDLSSEFARLHRLGAAAYVLPPLALCVAVAKTPTLRTNRLRLAYLLFGASFFLPTFLFDDQRSATMGYAITHGLQYLVFMGFVSVGRPHPLASLVMLLGMATLGAMALNAAILVPDLSGFPYGFVIYGAFIGAVAAHFVLDAGIWRLREPFQRGYMREKFHFIFNR